MNWAEYLKNIKTQRAELEEYCKQEDDYSALIMSLVNSHFGQKNVMDCLKQRDKQRKKSFDKVPLLDLIQHLIYLDERCTQQEMQLQEMNELRKGILALNKFFAGGMVSEAVIYRAIHSLQVSGLSDALTEKMVSLSIYPQSLSKLSEQSIEDIVKHQVALDNLFTEKEKLVKEIGTLKEQKQRKNDLIHELESLKSLESRYVKLIGELQSALVFLAKKRGINVHSSTEVMEFIKKYKRIAKEPDIYSSQSFTDGSGSLPQVSLDTLSDTVLDIYYCLYGRELDDSVLGDLSEIRRKGTLDAYIKRIQEEL